MPETKPLNVRDAKLIQWLSEAHAKEAELEADLTAHIALTEKASYKKRLRKHRTETRDHKRRVASRIKQLRAGGSPRVRFNLPGRSERRRARPPARRSPRSRDRSASGPGGREQPARGRIILPARRRAELRRSMWRSPCTRGSSRWPRRSGTARRPSWPRRSGATRSGWPSSWTPSWFGSSRSWSARRSRVISGPAAPRHRGAGPAGRVRPRERRQPRGRPPGAHRALVPAPDRARRERAREPRGEHPPATHAKHQRQRSEQRKGRSRASSRS